ncbi:sigma-54-dependent Fis family transcriptional regulator [Algiphilus sp.]|uniref:sigma-54-dependent Fis family transcriptional regulator n=1 Tax=Algiphilus sp. TaxID=1872431 RepID=UPI0032F06977
MNAPLAHADTVLRVVEGNAVVAADGDAGLIQRSWLRCYQDFRLDPASPGRMRVEASAALRQRREQHERYLRAARAGMEQLYRHVADLGYVLMLADADGVTLDFLGANGPETPLRDGLVIGADWNEAHAGTNGIGTCVAERHTLTCHREDHFFAGNLDLSCTATPLFDPLGELFGVLDVSAITTPEARESQHLVRHLTALYGRIIEDANFVEYFSDCWIIKLNTIAALAEINAEIMLAFDRDGVIRGANSGARHHLRVLEQTVETDLTGNSLSAVFRTHPSEIWRMAHGVVGLEKSTVDTWDGHRYCAVMRGPRRPPHSGRSTIVTPDDGSALEAIAGDDPQMRRVIEQGRRLAVCPLNILVQGETGTGKEVLARALHNSSPRAEKPFVAVNCAAIPESLIESELFGYTPGTFTGARSKGMTGLIQRADGGTLFLDEIGDMPLQLQTRLLRVLSESEVLPLGAEKPITLSLTVIAASHHNLQEQIRVGDFREDLFYRLCGATLELPPLRERQDRDFLIDALLHREAQALGTTPDITAQALEVLGRQSWPGNIRQLRNVLRYALSMSCGEPIAVAHLPEEVLRGEYAHSQPQPSASTTSRLEARTDDAASASGASEAERLFQMLRKHRWVITEVARELNLCRATIYRRMKRHGIVPPTHYC